MCEAALSGDGDQASIGRDDSVTNRVLRCQIGVGYLRAPESEALELRCSGEDIAHLDVLPNIGFWVDDAHVRLIGAAVDENSVVELEEAILGIVLPSSNPVISEKAMLARELTYGRVCGGDCTLGEGDDK